MRKSAPARQDGRPFFAIRKVKGHATQEEVDNGEVEANDKAGNDRADAEARKGAKRHALENWEVRQYYERQHRTVLTQAMMLKVWLARCAKTKTDPEGNNDDEEDDDEENSKENEALGDPGLGEAREDEAPEALYPGYPWGLPKTGTAW